MAEARSLVDTLDHPIPYVLAMTVAIMCMAALLTWGFKAAHMPGPASLFQHP